jgi:chemotaxis protein CheD
VPADTAFITPAGKTVHVIQGTHAVSGDPDVVLVSILGSCVSTCLWDDVAGVGGMNHFLLPEATSTDAEATLFGAYAMELLMNELFKLGAKKSRLKAKLFGGGRIVSGLSDVGAKNCAFARSFLEREGLPCISESLGGDRARRIRFWPVGGRAQQLILQAAIEESAPVSKREPADSGDVDLF